MLNTHKLNRSVRICVPRCRTRVRYVWNGRKWSKTVEIGRNRSKSVEIGRKIGLQGRGRVKQRPNNSLERASEIVRLMNIDAKLMQNWYNIDANWRKGMRIRPKIALQTVPHMGSALAECGIWCNFVYRRRFWCKHESTFSQNRLGRSHVLVPYGSLYGCYTYCFFIASQAWLLVASQALLDETKSFTRPRIFGHKGGSHSKASHSPPLD
jgi:hypothetical protein